MSTPRRISALARRLPLATLLFAVAVLAIDPVAHAQSQAQPATPQPDQASP